MRWLVALVAAATLIWAANTAMLGLSRHSYALATNRQIPSWLGKLGRRDETPYKAIDRRAPIAIGLVISGNIELLAGIYAFGATLAIAIAHPRSSGCGATYPNRRAPSGSRGNVRFHGR